MKLNKERTGRGLTVSSLYSPKELKEKMNFVAENMNNVFVPSDVSWEGVNYSFYISHRQSLKEYVCENGITKEEFFLFIKSIACLFESAKENNIDPHEFVFDYECIFVGENITELEFIFAPDSETYKDGIVAYNKCSDMVSIIALYIECNSSEQSLKQEKDILQALTIMSEWEKGPNIDTFPIDELSPLIEAASTQFRVGNYLKNTFYELFNCFIKKFNADEGDCGMRLKGELLLKDIKYVLDGNAPGSINIGRDEEWADVAVDIIYVSRKHAKIYKEKDTWFIKDLNSKNGTFVNGTRIASERPFSLDDGYEIGFGAPESRLIFCLP